MATPEIIIREQLRVGEGPAPLRGGGSGLADVLELSSQLTPVFFHSEEHSWGAGLEENRKEVLTVRSDLNCLLQFGLAWSVHPLGLECSPNLLLEPQKGVADQLGWALKSERPEFHS